MQEKNKRKCLLEDPRVTIAPQDPGEPPSWVPRPFIDSLIFWVNRDVFNNLKAKRHKKPCDICPNKIKVKCDREALARQMNIGRGIV